MKVISVDSARTTWLFPLTELNPTGKSLNDMFIKLKDRYKFKKSPAHMFDVDTTAKGFVFEQGESLNREGVLVVVKLSIFTDGAVADCWSSTRDSEDFLKDVMAWIKDDHGLTLPPDRLVKTLYMSELTVTTSKNLVSINPKLDELARSLAQKMAARGRPNEGYTVGGFALCASDWHQSGAPPQYRFEIKLGSKPGDRRYYSAAPVTTEDHIELLELQEKLLF